MHPETVVLPKQQADKVYSLKQAAEIAGVSPQTLRRRMNEDKIRILKLGPRRVGIRASELERFLKDAEVAV